MKQHRKRRLQSLRGSVIGAFFAGAFADLCWELFCRLSAREARIAAAHRAALYPWGRA